MSVPSGDSRSQWTMASSTRLIVKNLPKNADDAKVRAHFSKKGIVTDAKVAKTKDGKSRLFAFVGYATPEEAEQARKHFDRTFFNTSRLSVEIALPRGDASIGRPWSKHSEGSSKHPSAKKGAARSTATEEFEVTVMKDGAGAGGKKRPREESASVGGSVKDLEKKEFLEATKMRSRTKFWANDDVQEEEVSPPVQTTTNADVQVNGSGVDNEQGFDSASDSDSEREETVKREQSKKVSDLDWLHSKKGSAAFLDNVDDDSSSGSGRERAGNGDESDKDSDADSESKVAVPAVIAKKGTKRKLTEESTREDSHDVGKAINGAQAARAGSSRLFLRNLPYTCTEDDLRETFSAHGDVLEVHVVVDEMQRVKGFAFVKMETPEAASNAIAALDGTPLQGRLLHVMPAKDAPESAVNSSRTAKSGSSTFKQTQTAARKANADAPTAVASWNPSHLRSDAVVDAVSSRLGIAKGSVLDVEQGDMAVRLALAETQLVAENSEYFLREGVDLAAGAQAVVESGAKGAVNKKVERSGTCILVKNLPHATQAADLSKLFGAHGEVSRVLLPPSRSVALVEFIAPVDARRAFKRLAYTRFQHVPLYLEWAPTAAILKPKNGESTSTEPQRSAGAIVESIAGVSATADGGDTSSAGAPLGDSCTLYVKNLAWATTEESLRKCLSKAGGTIRAVKIPRKKAAGGAVADSSAQQSLGMGFGFVEFNSANEARTTMSALQGVILDGHALDLQTSTKRLTAAAPPGADVPTSKLIVRNVAFQASAKELRELFGSYGQLKRVRLPKKFDGQHRGFAFVDFATVKEAQSAYKALVSTHLYGRRLVLEWAQGDEDSQSVGALREKVVREITAGANRRQPAKRQKGEIGGFGDGDSDG